MNPAAVSILNRVLVALERTHVTDQALMLGLELGRRYGSELILCTAVDHVAAMAAVTAPDGDLLGSQLILDEYDATARALLSEATARAVALGAHVTTRLLDGPPVLAIVDGARESAVDAIVVGTHGKHGVERFFLGSVAEGVLRRTTLPTFVIHQPHDEPYDERPAAAPVAASHAIRAFERILVALDDSDPSDAALSFALELAAAKPSRLLCCTVIETADLLGKAGTYGYDPTSLLQDMRHTAADLLATKTAAVSERGLTPESIIVEGDAADAILEAAARHAADLIVVGTHGRRGLRRLFIGSVAESIVRRSAIPVAVVRSAIRPAS